MYRHEYYEPVGPMLIMYPVMQYKVLCLLWKVGSGVVLVDPFHYGGRTGVYLLSSFLLFRTRYVRYLMAFWCIFFMRVLILVFRIFSLISWSMECSCIAPLSGDGNEAVGFPTIVLYDIT